MPSPFKDRPFAARLATMGDLAETAFERHCERNRRGFVRWGLRLPPIQVGRLPKRIAYAPDYLTTRSFVECQGFGRDQVLKVKRAKLDALTWWSTLHPVELWAFDSKNDRSRLVPLEELTRLIDQGAVELGRFVEAKGGDTKAYFGFRATDLFEAA